MQIKFIISNWGRYFKFIVVICRRIVLHAHEILELANAVFLLGSLRLILSVSANLNQ